MNPAFTPSIFNRRFSKFKIRPNARRTDGASGPCRWEHSLVDSMQAFPCRFGKSGIGSNDVADHLPGREIQRSLRRRSHGERNGTLRAEADSLRGRFLPRTDAHGLGE